MQPNPFLKTLGFSDRDRVVVIHADDIGLSQATLPAIAELFAFGLVSSAALMVPCPWFPGAAAHAQDHPELDYDPFRSEALRAHLHELGIRVIGYEPLRAAMPVVELESSRS